ncbi:MAG: carbohydrate binding family 9 domain-containing protein [Acidobacteriota bacterium]|nr:carbohydrate binding family 9 domain-containing protein [Acidobacteriota bacterium]
MKTKTAVLFALSLCAAATARAANWPEHPTLHAVRVASGPTLDGDLSDPAWQNAPEFTDFTQHDPVDGAPATMPTSVRIVYDDRAIYFGAKMTDPHPPTALLARRDNFTQSDFLSINLDPIRDRVSGNAFTITPANVQLDTVLFNDIVEDGSWDGVWESSTKIVSDGWVAEVRIPYSQLRFPDRPVHTWGVNITRRTVRNNEWVRIVNTKKGETGFVSHFADIEGLEGIHRGRPLELAPYAVARSDIRTRIDEANPLLDGRTQRADGGLDVKYALTSDLTLTGTINPDFGQVEVDPAVVNLSENETFYPEKRPFFTEGVNIFRFGDTPAPSHFNFFFAPSLFYSRRIGRAPQLSPDADYVDAPAETTILGAAKLTGKLRGGWSIGVLDALTDAERARFSVDDRFGRQQVEPMTNYFVARSTKEFAGDTRVGMLFTSVNRRLNDNTSALRDSSITGGIDGYHRFLNKSWIAEGTLVGSRVSGSEEAIALTQRSASRYFQRPDASHIEYDPTRTSLTGWGGRAMLSKASGHWRPNLQTHVYSPGYETNDAGFMVRTDIVSSHALLQYVNDNPVKGFRSRTGWAGVWQSRNFAGDTIERGGLVDVQATFANYWTSRAALFVSPGSFSDRLTRGGPLVRTPSGWSSDLSVETDERKSLIANVTAHLEHSDDGSYVRTTGIELAAQPRTNLRLSVAPTYSRSHNATQYVTAFNDAAAADTYGRRYVFAHLEQHSFELATRADWTLSPTFSLQLYVQPFVAAGDYHDYTSLAAARTRNFAPYAGFTGNPDFNFRSVRGSAVARWEFRPGSALYVVWNENRAEVEPVGDFSVSRDLRAIPTAPSHDVFLVKVSYWLPM